MHDTGTWLICAVLAYIIVAAFAGKKAQWHPFGGMLKHDRKTGQVSVVLTLPGKKRSAKRGRKR